VSSAGAALRQDVWKAAGHVSQQTNVPPTYRTTHSQWVGPHSITDTVTHIVYWVCAGHCLL